MKSRQGGNADGHGQPPLSSIRLVAFLGLALLLALQKQFKMLLLLQPSPFLDQRMFGVTATPKVSPHNNTTLNAVKLNNTKIVAVANSEYKEIALMWHEQMTKLGYTTHVVATVDEDVHSFLQEKGVRVETLLPRDSGNWPLPLGKPQQNRRRIFGTRWVHVMAQLQKGYNVLLTDADNIFNRYLPMEELESSKYDVFHAYAGDFPIRFLSMGFTICGGMAWFRSSPPSIRYVQSILEQCGSRDLGSMAQCDDQQVANSQFFDNKLNYTFYNERPRNDTFWKHSLEGASQVTGHKFKIWDVNMAYRGPVDGKDGVCPKNNWVAMPLNSIEDPNNRVRKGDAAGERRLRLSQWMNYCGEVDLR